MCSGFEAGPTCLKQSTLGPYVVQILSRYPCAGKRSPAQFENNNFREMCSGSEAGSYVRVIDSFCHSV